MADRLPPLDLGDGICRIDTGLSRPGMAACYLVEGDGSAAFIDCGTWHSVPHLLEVLEEKAIPLDAVEFVIPTHVHLDHAGGAGELMRRLPRARLVVHPFGAKHLARPEKLQQGAIAVYGKELFRAHYHELVPVDEARILEAPDGFHVRLDGRRLEFLDTPGHASHHFCVWDERTRGFFTGDTFGLSYRETDVGGHPMVFPTTTPVQFKPERWQESLDKLAGFEPECMYLTHFGRVREVPRLMANLREGIRAHRAIAVQCRDAGDPAAAIRARLTEWFLARMEGHGIVRPREEMQALIAMDIELNTQGLMAWLERNQ